MDFLLLFSTTASLSHVAVDTIIPCQPTHSHCTQFRQLLLFFFLLSKSIFFAGPAHRKGFFASATSVTGCSGKWKIIAHSNATCIQRPAGLVEKFLSLLITTRFFWLEFPHFRPNFWDFLEHQPKDWVEVAISSPRSALHPHLFTHNSDEKFLLCTWKKAEKKNRLFCSRPLRAASYVQRLSIVHAALIAFPLSERGKTKNSPTNFNFFKFWGFANSRRKNLNGEHHFDCSYGHEIFSRLRWCG